MNAPAKKRSRKRVIFATVAILLAAGASFWGFRLAHPAPRIPTAVVRRGAFTDWLKLQGGIKAIQSVTILAPYRAGNLRILKLVPTGTRVKKGAVIVTFDATQLRQGLAQHRVAVRSDQAEVQQARAKARITEEKDMTDVMKARYDVQSAKLDASKAEILSQIAGEEAKLKLADARQKLAAAEAKLKSDRTSDAASIHDKQEALDEDRYQVQLDERILGHLVLRAPIDGIVTLLNTNWQAGGPFSGPQPFHPGDRIWSGAPIAELPNLSTLEVVARVDETERGRLAVGQKAELRFGAIPDRSFTGRVKAISKLASMDFSGGWPFPRNFSVRIALDKSDPRLRPTMKGTVRVAVDRVPSGILIPAEALFRRNGGRVAWVLHGSNFQPRKITVARQSSGQVLVAKGLQPGERVALKNPAPSQ